MRADLEGKHARDIPPSLRPIRQDPEKQRKPTIDICGISAAAFRMNLHRKENIFFAISLFEIDREIEARGPETSNMDPQRPDETELEWLKRMLPPELVDYADVFSKEASDQLPPHRPYDHKISIDSPKGPESLGYSPLRHQSTHELQETKRFLEENLQRGFIEPSQSPFASPVLFVRKPSSGLRFCVDY